MNITHRDLKPENILLAGPADYSLIKVTDFGLSKLLCSPESDMVTQVGTPCYKAPELWTEYESSYTPAVDLWSTGVIMFVCLVGHNPFSSKYNMPLENQIKTGRVLLKKNKWVNISRSAKRVVRLLMEVNAAERMTVEEALAHPWISADRAMRYDVHRLMYPGQRLPNLLKRYLGDERQSVAKAARHD